MLDEIKERHEKQIEALKVNYSVFIIVLYILSFKVQDYFLLAGYQGLVLVCVLFRLRINLLKMSNT